MQISNVGVLRPLCSLERLPSEGSTCACTCIGALRVYAVTHTTVLHTIPGSSVIIPLPPPCRGTGTEREGYDKLEEEKRDEKRWWPEGVAIVATRTEILRSLSDPPVLATFETE